MFYYYGDYPEPDDDFDDSDDDYESCPDPWLNPEFLSCLEDAPF